ncbi:general secretion pathway protein L [Dyella sp. SG562]|uniref:PilN domain-containing protein n=1 Tax=Dyella TaxID=231454 RepID=UPI00141D7EB0|nr:PilN domain-containing protein [Dyella sp. SG562]NII72699.1 general secretion pathway protein L [Dyella sp. SG562]
MSMTSSLRPQLEQVRRAWRASPLPRFFAWWGGELAALLPAGLRARFGGGAAWHLLERADGDWRLRRDGSSEPLAQWSDELEASGQQAALADGLRGVDREDLRLALCLPAAQVLRRPLLLPDAARDTLRQVGAFEMDRQTPFRPEQVRYDIRELNAPAPAGRIAAELVAVPRTTLDPLLGRLGQLGIAVDAVDMAVDAGRCGVNLLPPEQAPRRTRPRQRLNLALAAAIVVLAGLVLGEWLHNRRDALEQMQAQVETMRGEAQKVGALRQQLQDIAGAAGFLAERKKNTSSALAVLQDLSQRLPMTAWLERLSIDNTGQVGFQGQSPQAARLIDALKDSTVIANPNFQGTIQADPQTGKERFYMVAQLRKKIPAKPARPGAPGAAASSGEQP